MTALEEEIIRIARLQTPERRVAIEGNLRHRIIDLRLLDDDRTSKELINEYGLDSELVFLKRQAD